MTPVTIDAELVAKLTSNGGRVPLADSDGKVIGYFTAAGAVAESTERPADWMYREPTLEEFRPQVAGGVMFLLVWSRLAFDEMSDIVRDNSSRKHEFAVALRQITRQLIADAPNVGESREDELRVMFVGDLSVFYRVDEDDNTVQINNVRLRQS